MSETSFLTRLQNLTVEEFTTPCAVYVHPDTSLQEAQTIMKKERIRHLPVLSKEKKVLGILSERDIHIVEGKMELEKQTAQSIMQPDPYCTSSDTKISDVALCMSENKYGSAIIFDADGNLGIFTSIDALNALIEVVRGDI